MLQHIILCLTGYVGRKYLVKFHCAGEVFDVFLTGRGLYALTDLCRGRLEEPNYGRSTLPTILGKQHNRTSAIHDLRIAADAGLGIPGFGHDLVENHYWNEYSLGLPADAIRFESGFKGLAPRHLSTDVVEAIVTLAHPVSAAVPAKGRLIAPAHLPAEGVLARPEHGDGFSAPFGQPRVSESIRPVPWRALEAGN